MTDLKMNPIDVGDMVEAIWFWPESSDGDWRAAEVIRIQNPNNGGPVASLRFYDPCVEAACAANPADRLFSAHQIRLVD